ncbi:MAG: 4Fe-4S binding protein [Oscillospiraceae bacterium]|nr:4Fe-4S binding protein [Oscillospiraceae bacterium]
MLCTPGLNCYSCPAAVTSCPVGAMQLFLAGAKHSVSLFVTGFLVTSGVAFGRLICGFVCPMGLLQDLLYKIKAPKFKARFRYIQYIKYLILALFVMILPFAVRNELSGLGSPWFCKYICPAGTVFGALPLFAANSFLRGFAGVQFAFKLMVASAVLSAAILNYRFFCRVLCPLGAFYSLFNRTAFIKIRFNCEKCVSCGDCSKACHLKIEPPLELNSPECMRCGNCIRACGSSALSYKSERAKS